MTPAYSVVLCALLALASLTRVQCQTTSETSTTETSTTESSTTETSSSSSSDHSTTDTSISETSTSETLTSETSTTSSAHSITSTSESSTSETSTTSTSETSTTVPGPFFMTQSVVFLSNGTQEEVEYLVLGALDFVLAETTTRGYGPLLGLSRPAVVYEFVHDGHCADGWIVGNIATPNVEVCALHCQTFASCGFFAWDTVSTTCARYYAEDGCPDDNQYPTYNAYRLFRGVCSDGLVVTPLMPSECPSHASELVGCEIAGPGSLCEADDLECGVSGSTNNCGDADVFRKQEISCMDDTQCPLRYRCSTDSGMCVSDVSYGNLTARSVTGLELRSADGEAISGFLADFADAFPESPSQMNLFDGGDLKYALAVLLGYPERRLTTDSPATLWRIDLEVTANDLYSSELVHRVLSGFSDHRAVERNDFEDAIRALAANHSLSFDDFRFSSPLVRRPTETTTTETQTATTATTVTTMTSGTFTTTTTTTTTAITTVGPAGRPASPDENSTALVMAVAGGAIIFLALVSGIVFLMLKRRKVGDVLQHNGELENNEQDAERATATATSKCSSERTFEI